VAPTRRRCRETAYSCPAGLDQRPTVYDAQSVSNVRNKNLAPRCLVGGIITLLARKSGTHVWSPPRPCENALIRYFSVLLSGDGWRDETFRGGRGPAAVALLPHCLDDYVTENNPVRVIEAFIGELDLAILGFEGVVPETTGRPAYHPAALAEDLSLRLSQPHPVEPTPGAGDPA
jgi:hypothetical protein